MQSRTAAPAQPATYPNSTHRNSIQRGNTMRIRNVLLASTAATAAVMLQLGLALAPAQAQSAIALAGKVSSAAEPVMEGVVVSAKKDGTTITVSVITNEKGEYSFPANRLEPGHY